MPRLSAALAFYTTFSVAPLLVISVALAGVFFGKDAVQGRLIQALHSLLGKDGAEGVQALVVAAGNEQHSGVIASAIGIVVLLFGATGVFVELKDALNTIWHVEARPDLGITGLIKTRILSFVMVLSCALLLLVSMILTALLSSLGHLMAISVMWAQVTDAAVSSIVITLMFMGIFKFLPDAEIQWKDVWIGALVSATLFTVGKYLVGLYFAKTAIASAYGAVGSLVVFLLWTYYSSLILFFGAEFTHASAQLRRSR